MPTQVIMPQLGESVVEGTVTQWLKSVGDSIDEFEPLLEVNTDKVDTEIPSPAAGTLLKVLIPEGETVDAGTILAWIGDPGEELPDGEAPSLPKLEPDPQPTQPVAKTQPSTSGRDRDLGFISPVVAKMAAAHGIDLTQVPGTGRNGRITKKDVQAFLDSGRATVIIEPPTEEVQAWETPADGDLFRPTEMIFGTTTPEAQAEPEIRSSRGSLLPLTPVRKAIAEHMINSKKTSPHVTTVMEADMKSIVQHRDSNKVNFQNQGVKLTFTPYFIAAVVNALRAYPIVNSSWTDQGIRIHQDLNVGMATSMGEEGLIVPVIKNADQYSLVGLARVVNDLANRARVKKLKPDEVQGGTFTITNHGTSGSLFASPIINQPQSAILGIGVIQKRVVVIDDAIAIRPMVYISLTIDHRILDGAIADYFLGEVVKSLENWRD